MRNPVEDWPRGATIEEPYQLNSFHKILAEEGLHKCTPKEECSPEVHDAVNHPKHYTSHPSGVECITITEHYNFCVGNAIKYLWRNGLKSDEGSSSVKDLKKAVWYITREIENLEKKNASS